METVASLFENFFYVKQSYNTDEIISKLNDALYEFCELLEKQERQQRKIR